VLLLGACGHVDDCQDGCDVLVDSVLRCLFCAATMSGAADFCCRRLLQGGREFVASVVRSFVVYVLDCLLLIWRIFDISNVNDSCVLVFGMVHRWFFCIAGFC